MIRRKLFPLTVSYISGVVTGYIALERSMPLLACFFIGGILISMRVSVLSVCEPGICDTGLVIKKLISFLFAGLILFSFSYFRMLPMPEADAENIRSLTGVVRQVRETENSTKFILEGNGRLEGDRILCSIYHDEGEPSTIIEANGISEVNYDLQGKGIEITGKLKVPESAGNPNCFDYRLYLKTKGIKYTFSVDSLKTISDEPSLYFRFKKRILLERLKYEKEFIDNEEVYGMLKGILFGDKSFISDEISEDFIGNGTAHVLAVSGLHIGFILGMLRFLSSKRRTPGSALFIALILLIYGELTMWNPSTVRSVIIAVLAIFSVYLGRSFDLLSALSAAALLSLIYRPYMLFNAGFAMSYLAVCGIAFWGRALESFMSEYAAFVIGVQFSVLPFTVLTFNRFNPLTILINIPVVLLASLLVPVAVISFAVGIIWGIYPWLLTETVSLMTELMIYLNKLLYLDGKFSFDAVSVNPGIIVGIYAMGACLSSENVRIRLIRKQYNNIGKLLLALILPALIIGIAFQNSFSDDEIVFIDVGQGDAIHIRSDDMNVIFDGGGNPERNIGETVLRPYFLKNGVKGLDACLFSHNHTDHSKGAKELAEVFPVNRFLISDIYVETKDFPEGTGFLTAGDRIDLSERCSLEVIWPAESENERIDLSEENENNMVVIVYYDDIKTMLTGDLTAEDELKMVEYYKGTDKLECDVLKVGHHGSKGSSSDAFLAAADPKIAVIQVGKNNIYGHPNEDIVKKFKEKGVALFRTDRDGAVGLDIKGKYVIAETVRR